jgi:hypothetical protein
MKRLKCIGLVAITSCLLSACISSHKNEAEVIYSRPDVSTEVSKLIVFPTTNFEGQTTNDIRLVDASINANWIKLFGKDKAIPAGLAIEQISNQIGKKIGQNPYILFISMLDNISGVEQVLADENVKKFIELVTDKLGAAGKSQFALALVSGSEEGYNKGEPIYINIGLFDVKTLTWKVITKTKSTKTKFGIFKTDYNGIIKDHFATIKNNIENPTKK